MGAPATPSIGSPFPVRFASELQWFEKPQLWQRVQLRYRSAGAELLVMRVLCHRGQFKSGAEPGLLHRRVDYCIYRYPVRAHYCRSCLQEGDNGKDKPCSGRPQLPVDERADTLTNTAIPAFRTWFTKADSEMLRLGAKRQQRRESLASSVGGKSSSMTLLRRAPFSAATRALGNIFWHIHPQ
ncbi:hypothetical protein PsYK624_119750 [Phanerochaete sordida]|uniref:Uncharacterized protein n=1 Tax=Phanerochaete sordida TaxID=48140 RepID=A0A9P3LJ25_9APHY|nr:hypothetical protein PsYK624_119750 [Phanerochaete sordida]